MPLQLVRVVIWQPHVTQQDGLIPAATRQHVTAPRLWHKQYKVSGSIAVALVQYGHQQQTENMDLAEGQYWPALTGSRGSAA